MSADFPTSAPAMSITLSRVPHDVTRRKDCGEYWPLFEGQATPYANTYVSSPPYVTCFSHSRLPAGNLHGMVEYKLYGGHKVKKMVWERRVGVRIVTREPQLPATHGVPKFITTR